MVRNALQHWARVAAICDPARQNLLHRAPRTWSFIRRSLRAFGDSTSPGSYRLLKNDSLYDASKRRSRPTPSSLEEVALKRLTKGGSPPRGANRTQGPRATEFDRALCGVQTLLRQQSTTARRKSARAAPNGRQPRLRSGGADHNGDSEMTNSDDARRSLTSRRLSLARMAVLTARQT